jgi:hypothetical protein
MSYKVSREVADKVANARNAAAPQGTYFEVSRANAENTLFNVVKYQRDRNGVAQHMGCLFISDLIAAFPLAAAEFPDFDLSTMPAVPAGYAESSFRNDACPSFWNEAAALQIFIDYADASQREHSDGARFHVVNTSTGETVAESDEWQEALKAALAADYIATVGYNPFEDDATITTDEVAQTLVEYRAEFATDSGATLVTQDGADFYFSLNGDRMTVSYPGKVADFDLPAATAARAWFINVYCRENGIDPEFGA